VEGVRGPAARAEAGTAGSGVGDTARPPGMEHLGPDDVAVKLNIGG
jgi:hypothetical protein